MRRRCPEGEKPLSFQWSVTQAETRWIIRTVSSTAWGVTYEIDIGCCLFEILAWSSAPRAPSIDRQRKVPPAGSTLNFLPILTLEFHS